MIVEHLSDHAGQLLEQSQQQLMQLVREKEYWEEQMWLADDDRVNAHRRRSFLQKFLGHASEPEVEAYERYEDSRRRLDQVDYQRRQLQITVDRQTTGVRGEERLENALKWLTNDWTMIRGYKNRNGEVDHLLVGPAGIWAVEVKSSNVRLQVDGKSWWQEKIDRRGRVMKRLKASDRTGRTWGRQVADVASGLERHLRHRGQAVTVRTAVVLMHDRAQIGDIKKSGVDFVGTDHRILLSKVAEQGIHLDQSQVADLVALIKKDHQFHEHRQHERRHQERERQERLRNKQNGHSHASIGQRDHDLDHHQPKILGRQPGIARTAS